MKRDTHHDNKFLTDSMISIIANPELYDGKNVQVCGVLHLNYEDIALYLTKEDADYIRSENALCVAFSEDTVTFQPENWGSFSVKNIDVHGFKTPWERERVLHLNGKAVMVNGTYNAERNTVYNISHGLPPNNRTPLVENCSL